MVRTQLIIYDQHDLPQSEDIVADNRVIFLQTSWSHKPFTKRHDLDDNHQRLLGHSQIVFDFAISPNLFIFILQRS